MVNAIMAGINNALHNEFGYGSYTECIEQELDRLPLRSSPKWVIGYSDISALHALMNRHGIASIHAPMAKHLASFKGKDEYSQSLFSILEGNMPER